MKILRKINKEVIPLNKKQRIIILLIIAFVFQFTLFYTPALADRAMEQLNIQDEVEEIISFGSFNREETMNEEAAQIVSQEIVTETIIDEETKEVVIRTSVHTMTAYNSEPGQTDDSPCITANNFNVCDHGIEDTIAANFLKFGTKVKIPELFGDRVFIVRDRMNRRYTSRVDIWMLEKSDALNFGIKTAKIEVIE